MFDPRNHLAAAHARAFLELQSAQPPARLDADVAAAARDDVAGGDENRNGRRTAGRRHHGRGVRDVDLRRPAFVHVLARPGIDRATASSTTSATTIQASHGRGGRACAIDSQPGQIGRTWSVRVRVDCHRKTKSAIGRTRIGNLY